MLVLLGLLVIINVCCWVVFVMKFVVFCYWELVLGCIVVGLVVLVIGCCVWGLWLRLCWWCWVGLVLVYWVIGKVIVLVCNGLVGLVLVWIVVILGLGLVWKIVSVLVFWLVLEELGGVVKGFIVLENCFWNCCGIVFLVRVVWLIVLLFRLGWVIRFVVIGFLVWLLGGIGWWWWWRILVGWLVLLVGGIVGVFCVLEVGWRCCLCWIV